MANAKVPSQCVDIDCLYSPCINNAMDLPIPQPLQAVTSNSLNIQKER
ncbi:MAG TPA: hypothetical protein PKE09_02120 [Chitinophagales bacterium]|nr:hypothetical protein [Chitinophagales bacterium]HMW11938.1 hypothetical protein [Chitinophagales bacterium]HNB48799.1 hypothetical protein [Chitinophagales bacterium]HNI33551.1 hypothetical protein [Chitinophagales bacterium]HNL56422.1 hypothetical protein [Chitinophagales bacterium]